MSETASQRCPVCRVRFRETTECPRCGADLTALMRLIVRAYQERQRARDCLNSGQATEGAVHLAHAQQLCATPAGHRLSLLTAWLRETDQA